MAGAVMFVTMTVKPDRIDDFLAAMKTDAEGSRAEAGCLRFDLLEHGEGVYSFYEVYRDAEAMSHHKTLPHCNAARGPRAL